MSIPLLCIALLGLLLMVLGFNVSRVRAITKTVYGGDERPDSPLYKAQRAHGNTVEYAPLLALLMLALSQFSQPPWVIWSMILATFFRYLFVFGILFPKTMAKPNPFRFVGGLGTYITGLALVLALFFQVTSA